MKKILVFMMMFTMAVSMTACGSGSEKDTATVEKEADSKESEKEVTENKTDETERKSEVSEKTESSNNAEESKPSGIEDDGIGGDASDMTGEGIGEVIALSDAEKAYVLKQTTNSWLELSQIEKDDLVVLIGRWWEGCENYIVEDYERMVADLDHQMETYFRNKVDAGVMETACDIYGLDITVITAAIKIQSSSCRYEAVLLRNSESAILQDLLHEEAPDR